MRWLQIKEGYQKKQLYVNVDQLANIKFAVGSDGAPMAYLIYNDGMELTTHDPEDLEKVKQILQRNAC